MNNIQHSYICNQLKKEGIICIPTDTVWGLLCMASSNKAVQDIYRLKQRQINKPLALLVNNTMMAAQLIELNNLAKNLLNYPQMAITIIAKQKFNSKISRYVNLKTQNLAVRIPKVTYLTKIINTLNTPIAATSANLSGKEFTTEQIYKYFPKYITNYKVHHINTDPSVIIDFTRSRAKIIRATPSQEEIIKKEFNVFANK